MKLNFDYQQHLINSKILSMSSGMSRTNQLSYTHLPLPHSSQSSQSTTTGIIKDNNSIPQQQHSHFTQVEMKNTSKQHQQQLYKKEISETANNNKIVLVGHNRTATPLQQQNGRTITATVPQGVCMKQNPNETNKILVVDDENKQLQQQHNHPSMHSELQNLQSINSQKENNNHFFNPTSIQGFNQSSRDQQRNTNTLQNQSYNIVNHHHKNMIDGNNNNNNNVTPSHQINTMSFTQNYQSTHTNTHQINNNTNIFKSLHSQSTNNLLFNNKDHNHSTNIPQSIQVVQAQQQQQQKQQQQQLQQQKQQQQQQLQQLSHKHSMSYTTNPMLPVSTPKTPQNIIQQPQPSLLSSTRILPNTNNNNNNVNYLNTIQSPHNNKNNNINNDVVNKNQNNQQQLTYNKIFEQDQQKHNRVDQQNIIESNKQQNNIKPQQQQQYQRIRSITPENNNIYEKITPRLNNINNNNNNLIKLDLQYTPSSPLQYAQTTTNFNSTQTNVKSSIHNKNISAHFFKPNHHHKIFSEDHSNNNTMRILFNPQEKQTESIINNNNNQIINNDNKNNQFGDQVNQIMQHYQQIGQTSPCINLQQQQKLNNNNEQNVDHYQINERKKSSFINNDNPQENNMQSSTQNNNTNKSITTKSRVTPQSIKLNDISYQNHNLLNKSYSVINTNNADNIINNQQIQGNASCRHSSNLSTTTFNNTTTTPATTKAAVMANIQQNNLNENQTGINGSKNNNNKNTTQIISAHSQSLNNLMPQFFQSNNNTQINNSNKNVINQINHQLTHSIKDQTQFNNNNNYGITLLKNNVSQPQQINNDIIKNNSTNTNNNNTNLQKSKNNSKHEISQQSISSSIVSSNIINNLNKSNNIIINHGASKSLCNINFIHNPTKSLTQGINLLSLTPQSSKNYQQQQIQQSVQQYHSIFSSNNNNVNTNHCSTHNYELDQNGDQKIEKMQQKQQQQQYKEERVEIELCEGIASPPQPGLTAQLLSYQNSASNIQPFQQQQSEQSSGFMKKLKQMKTIQTEFQDSSCDLPVVLESEENHNLSKEIYYSHFTLSNLNNNINANNFSNANNISKANNNNSNINPFMKSQNKNGAMLTQLEQSICLRQQSQESNNYNPDCGMIHDIDGNGNVSNSCNEDNKSIRYKTEQLSDSSSYKNIKTDNSDSSSSVNSIFFSCRKYSMKDFEFLKQLGKGVFGQVFMVRDKKTKGIYAIKMIEKSMVREKEMEGQVQRELTIHLEQSNSNKQNKNSNSSITNFEDEEYYYILMEYASDGTCAALLDSYPMKRIHEAQSLQISYQLLLAIYALHSRNVIHRDLKLENILLSNGVVKLCDFGCATYCENPPYQRRRSFCGTVDYLSPEMIQDQFYDKEIDIWAYGVIVFELNAGYAPFSSHNEQMTYASILKGKINYPRNFSENLKDFLSRIFVCDIQKRWTAKQLLCHKWIQQLQQNQQSALHA